MSLEKTEKGLVYKLSQKCLDQEEEINNLLHNVAELQEVVQKKQTEINKLKAEMNMIRAREKYSESMSVRDLVNYNQKEKNFHKILMQELKTN